MLQVELVREKETKNKVRFVEAGQEIFGTIYIPKETLASMGNPDRLTLTLEADAAAQPALRAA